ncbi:MAG: 3-oxoacyl-[acyl-carrier protein] reductase [Oceanicoccus sp.]|jgi:3-oxoacyl-[acyl-carrier protein] reductase
MDFELNNKIALVTGSNRGTGEVIAQALAREGATVIFHSNEEDAAADAAAKVERAYGVWGDITNDQGAQQVIAQVEKAVGSVDILVNNYGTTSRGTWSKSTTEDWLDIYQKNVLSATRMIQAIVPGMKEKGWGRIIQLGTIGSHRPNAVMPHYYAAKGALATMSVSLANELTHTGITVNTVSPGLIRTPELEVGFRKRAIREGWGDSWSEIESKIVELDFPNPCGRIAEREEVADLVVFLSSNRASFFNGQNIRIDGGAVNYV